MTAQPQVTLTFSSKDPLRKDVGFKFVLYEITTAAPVQTKHDWGFAYWNGKTWDATEVPKGWSCKVVWWSHTPDPGPLVTVGKKIISLNGKNGVA